MNRAPLSSETPPRRILVAGIGNIFLGDDAFGVEVVRQLGPQLESVRVVDFGIRGMELAFALEESYDLVILVDAMARGGAPGTVYVLEPDPRELESVADVPIVEAHGMDPLRVMRLVKHLGFTMSPMKIVGCEPATFGSDEDPAMGLSPVVEAAVAEAVQIVQRLVDSALAIG
jgi:hydrogenase maturation protease